MKFLIINRKILLLNLFLSTICFSQSLSDTLYFGFSNKVLLNIRPADAQVALSLLVSHISNQKLKNVIETKFYDNSVDIISDYNLGKIHFLAVLAQDYIKLKNKISLDAEFVSKMEGSVLFKYYLLTNRSRNIFNGANRNNKLIIFNSMGNDLPYEWLDNLLEETYSTNAQGVFGDIKEVRKPSQAVLPVFFGNAEACIITDYAYKTIVELNPQIEDSLLINYYSPDFPLGVLCLSNGLVPEYKKVFKQSISELSLAEKGKQILSLFKIEDNVEFKEEYLKNLYELFDPSERMKN